MVEHLVWRNGNDGGRWSVCWLWATYRKCRIFVAPLYIHDIECRPEISTWTDCIFIYFVVHLFTFCYCCCMLYICVYRKHLLSCCTSFAASFPYLYRSLEQWQWHGIYARLGRPADMSGQAGDVGMTGHPLCISWIRSAADAPIGQCCAVICMV